MSPHSTRCRIALAGRLAALLALTCPAVAAESSSETATRSLAQANTDTVWCHDVGRSIVKRMAAWRCEGRVVSDEEARRIKQERIERIQRVLQREKEPVVPGKRLRGTGTGFFISVQGEVLTNHHVVDDCRAVTVTPAGGSEIVASIRGSDERRDLALLDTGRSWPLAAVFRGFDEVTPGEAVTVVGYPNHGRVVIKPILVTGNVLEGAQPGNPHVFAMKIDIRRGNSGGPVLDESGRVLGVVFAKVDTPAVYAKTGKLIRDVGLGMRLHVVREFLRPLSVDARSARQALPLEHEARFTRARDFVAQIGCWH